MEKMKTKNSIENFEEFLAEQASQLGIDWGLKIEVAAECCWSAELRITPKPNAYGPDESIVLLTGGATGPENAVRNLTIRAKEIIAELNQKQCASC